MSLEAAIRSALIADAKTSAIVEERIFLGGMPEEFPYPAVTMIVSSELALQVNQGLTNAREASLRLDLWTDDYPTARRLLEACRYALVGRAFTSDGVRVGTITEDASFILAPQDPAEIWHGVLELSTPYRYER